jgi:hypothetical protein
MREEAGFLPWKGKVSSLLLGQVNSNIQSAQKVTPSKFAPRLSQLQASNDAVP